MSFPCAFDNRNLNQCRIFSSDYGYYCVIRLFGELEDISPRGLAASLVFITSVVVFFRALAFVLEDSIDISLSENSF
jgi:hypothetical protein